MVFGLKKKNCKIKFKLVLNIKIILFKYIFLIYFLEKKNNEKISHVISYNMWRSLFKSTTHLHPFIKSSKI